ncbi:MAG: heliorhodopsin HeR [Nitriliruptorales bacterium]|nr:heliorhodopsin HeR [Nitriliruptorales bacterium]
MALDTRTARRLRRLNLGVGAAHLAQAILMATLSNDLAIPVVAAFLDNDPAVAFTGASEPTRLFGIPVGLTVALFLLFAAIDHLAVAAPRLHERYEAMLAEGRNTVRWIEYSVSASIMIVLIAGFVGVWDLAALLAIFGVNSAMILFGLLMERQQRPGSADWSAFWFGSLVGAVPWVIVSIYLFANVSQVPGFVLVIYAVELVLFFSFALNMWLQFAQVGRWKDSITVERSYIWLSLGAKSLLAWLIFANVLRT